MRECYYLSQSQEEKIESDITLLWNTFDSFKLYEFEMDNIDKKIEVEAMTCYSKEYFYVAVRTNQDKLTDNDRAYQNGDGFHFVIAYSKSNEAKTDEFYVIGVSPHKNNTRGCFVWYRNIDLAGYTFENAKVRNNILDGKSYNLVRIPWKEIEPFKPLILKNIGFNISYVQDVKGNKNTYILKKDDYIQSEESLREYELFEFQQPNCNKYLDIVMNIREKHVSKGRCAYIDIGINSSTEENLSLKAIVNNNFIIHRDFKINKRLNIFEIPIENEVLNEGDNEIILAVVGKEITEKLTNQVAVYDMNNLANLEKEIKDIEDEMTEDVLMNEGVNSLKFLVHTIKSNIDKLKYYEEFTSISEDIKKLKTGIKTLKKGYSLFECGHVKRLAFKSSYDNTLQPYSIYIPKSLEKSNEKKLLIYLHGSGSDDTSVSKNALNIRFAEEEQCIIVAPYGRGVSNCYCPKESLEDIVELTKKIKDIFCIDDKYVFLSGFSMGGYGVLRVYDYCSDIYNGIIMMSGHYDIPSILGFEGEPNYILDENIKKFSDVPFIIYHGAKDKNCSYEEMEVFIEKLKEVNSKVCVKIDNEEGHVGLTEKFYGALIQWLKSSDV